jgi:hypothetical protein
MALLSRPDTHRVSLSQGFGGNHRVSPTQTSVVFVTLSIRTTPNMRFFELLFPNTVLDV